MPRTTPSTKLVLWDELHISLYGPSDIRNDSVARRGVEKLMASFGHVIRKCMRDCRRQTPVLKRFRVRVQS
ncbi:MAG TPA: hypothetical protein VMW38_24845 [Terriglobia bacterium]|nr:hypothetical protein [Terriglobia bacterium]